MTANRKTWQAGFTLVELLVVIIIVAILSALTLGGLRSGAVRAKEGATRLLVTKLSDAVMELLEELEDLGKSATDTGADDLYCQLPNSRSFAMHSYPPFGTTYSAYAAGINAAANERAECLYMILTTTGVSRSVLEALHSRDVGDTDGDGANEFLDAWGKPIDFIFSPPSTRVALTTPNQLPLIRSYGVDGNDDGGFGDDIQNIYVDSSGAGFFRQ